MSHKQDMSPQSDIKKWILITESFDDFEKDIGQLTLTNPSVAKMVNDYIYDITTTPSILDNGFKEFIRNELPKILSEYPAIISRINELTDTDRHLTRKPNNYTIDISVSKLHGVEDEFRSKSVERSQKHY